jgi:hypothetical protein
LLTKAVRAEASQKLTVGPPQCRRGGRASLWLSRHIEAFLTAPGHHWRSGIIGRTVRPNACAYDVAGRVVPGKGKGEGDPTASLRDGLVGQPLADREQHRPGEDEREDRNEYRVGAQWAIRK